MRLVLKTIALFVALAASVRAGQLLPPPGDGEIRAVYWELRNESQVWLTLQPRNTEGARAPMVTFTCTFAGKRPTVRATRVEVRAYAETFWAPRPQFWFVLDGKERIVLAPSAVGLTTGTPSDYLTDTISIDVLKRIAGARRIAGKALGFEFELVDSQRAAIRRFLDRVISGDPVGAIVR